MLALLACIWYVCVQLVRGLGISLHLYRRFKRNSKPASQPPVSILRPMLGADENLYECLKSAFIQNYENFEILMLVKSSEDPAILVAQKLISEFPNVNAQLVVGESNAGINPKVCNLIKGYNLAANDLLWVLDSNVCMPPNALANAVPLLKNNLTLVHHLPLTFANAQPGLGGLLDEVYMLTAHSTFYSGINCVGVAPCVTGKSNLYYKSGLGPLDPFAKYMAEDQMISETLWRKGGRTAVAPDGAIQLLNNNIKFNDFFQRRSRWIRLRKYMVTSATLVEPFTDCFFGTAVLCLLARLSFSWFLWLSCGWCALDYFNYRVLGGKRPVWEFLYAWLIRESVAFPLWVYAMSGTKILWRSNYYKINPNLEAEPAN